MNGGQKEMMKGEESRKGGREEDEIKERRKMQRTEDKRAGKEESRKDVRGEYRLQE